MADLVIRGASVLTAGGIGPASVHVRDGKIDAVRGIDDVGAAAQVVEAPAGSIVMPGLVDTHVHINEPGRTEWEGFNTATRAAAAGGVTTIVDMPLNSIPATTSKKALEEKLRAAEGKCFVDVGFWGGVVPGNTGELRGLHEAGVTGFKCFMVPSGVEEFQPVNADQLSEALDEIARLNSVLIAHAELPGPIEEAAGGTSSADPASYETFLRSRPKRAENLAIELLIELTKRTGALAHVVHLSSAEALPLISHAQGEGVKITAETCPHYLTITAEEIPRGATEFKCCPPVRESANREALWQGLKNKVIGMIVSDHSPSPASLKCGDTGDFLNAWGGISSLQLRLPVTWTEVLRRGFDIEDLAGWLCSAPAELVGLENRKGRIAQGFDADIVIWNPDEKFSVTESMIEHRHKLTPYLGRTLSGVVETTFVRGRKIWESGAFISEPAGQFLRRD